MKEKKKSCNFGAIDPYGYWLNNDFLMMLQSEPHSVEIVLWVVDFDPFLGQWFVVGHHLNAGQDSSSEPQLPISAWAQGSHLVVQCLLES